MNLDQTTTLCRLLGDPTRLRLLSLLRDNELTVAEITRVTQLAQSRVSTHLAKLREAGLLRDRRSGVSVFYRFDSSQLQEQLPPADALLWNSLLEQTQDAMLADDQQRLLELLAARNSGLTWAEGVAGDMRRHYSPGRTWEATSRGVFALLKLGNVLDMASGDGALAESLAPHCEQYTAVDISNKVLAAGTERLQHIDNVNFVCADMHNTSLPDASYDQVLLLHALSYSQRPEQVAAETARLLKPGGQLAVATLNKHQHSEQTAEYNHVNNGHNAAELRALFEQAGLVVTLCDVTSRESKPPHFEVITLAAHRPA